MVYPGASTLASITGMKDMIAWSIIVWLGHGV